MPAAVTDRSTSRSEVFTDRPAWILWAIRALAAVAMLLALYLSIVSADERAAPAGCGPGSGCEAVLRSKWGYWFGIAVSRPALVVYAAILAASCVAGPATHPVRRRRAWIALTGMAALAAVSAIWFIALQAFIVRSFCPWCTALHACGLAIAVLAWRGLPLAPHADAGAGDADTGAMRRYDPNAVPRRPAMLSAIVGAAGVVVLMVGQLASEAPAMRVQVGWLNVRDSGSTQPATTRAATAPAITTTPTAPVEPAPALGSDRSAPLDIDLAEHPVVGPRTSRNILVVMNDYTCPHCRELHHAIDAARTRYGPSKFAVVSVPVPLNPKCNSAVFREQFRQRYACELATLALTVFRADASKFPDFDRWLYEPPDAPTADAARAKAVELVGEAKLKAAEADPWVKTALDRNVGMYRRAGTGRLPKLFVDDAGETGAGKPAELFELLEKRLGLKPLQ